MAGNDDEMFPNMNWISDEFLLKTFGVTSTLPIVVVMATTWFSSSPNIV